MKTLHFKREQALESENINKLADIIKGGGLVVFPTETVYGIGADINNEQAIKKIYETKGRPSDNPLILHLANKEDVNKYVKEVSTKAEQLMNAFWPGPLTLVLKKSKLVPYYITGGLETVALRVPNNEIALELIKHSQTGICAPSANESGRPSSTLYEHVVEDFNNKVDAIIDGGLSHIGLESTVVDVSSDDVHILRPGFITKEMIEDEIGKISEVTNKVDDKTIPKAPGMKYKHYSPNGDVFIISGSDNFIINKVNEIIKEEERKKIGVICTDDLLNNIDNDIKFNLGNRSDKTSIAQNLYKSLRYMDKVDADIILIESTSELGLGEAIMNRLTKASKSIIKE